MLGNINSATIETKNRFIYDRDSSLTLRKHGSLSHVRTFSLHKLILPKNFGEKSIEQESPSTVVPGAGSFQFDVDSNLNVKFLIIVEQLVQFFLQRRA